MLLHSILPNAGTFRPQSHAAWGGDVGAGQERHLVSIQVPQNTCQRNRWNQREDGIKYVDGVNIEKELFQNILFLLNIIHNILRLLVFFNILQYVLCLL